MNCCCYIVLFAKFSSLSLLFSHYYLNQWWDIGKGFKIPEVYRTGYTVIALSIITSIAVALLWAQTQRRWAGMTAEEEVEGMWTGVDVGILCICCVLACSGPLFIRVLNKELYCALRWNGVVMFLSLGINYTLESFWGHQMQRECKVHANVTQFTSHLFSV